MEQGARLSTGIRGDRHYPVPGAGQRRSNSANAPDNHAVKSDREESAVAASDRDEIKDKGVTQSPIGKDTSIG